MLPVGALSVSEGDLHGLVHVGPDPLHGSKRGAQIALDHVPVARQHLVRHEVRQPESGHPELVRVDHIDVQPCASNRVRLVIQENRVNIHTLGLHENPGIEPDGP